MMLKWSQNAETPEAPEAPETPETLEAENEVQLADVLPRPPTPLDEKEECELEALDMDAQAEPTLKRRKLSAAALRLFPIYEKIDRHQYMSPEDFNHICLMVGGDTRRVFQRVLMGIYQRAHLQKNGADVKKARTLLSLHESGQLLPNIDNLDTEMFL